MKNKRLALNKGAMFGLDARIALAIFGALSVISGAALYSAIQDAKVTAIVTSLSEMSKAYESYLIDTGQHLPVSSGSSVSDLDGGELLASALPGWKGPYLAYQLTDEAVSDVIFDFAGYKYAYYRQTSAADFGALSDWNDPPCSSGNMCYIYAILRGSEDIGLINAVDKKVDGTVDHDAGKMRIHTSAVGESRFAMQIIAYKMR